MHVRRLKLHGVKSLWQDIPTGGDPLPPTTRHRLLLQGGNGSGKTTILESIILLWEFFGEWIDVGDQRPFNVRRRSKLTAKTAPALLDAELAAVELADFPESGKSLWIGAGHPTPWRELKREYRDAAFAGVVYEDADSPNARIELPNGDWRTFRQRSMVGAALRENMVHFPPDNRTVAPTPEQGPRLIDTTQFNWLATYNPDLDLDSLLLTVKALRPKTFDEAIHFANLALQHRNKRIVGFGDDGRLTIEGETNRGKTYRHPVEALSSGERQFLLLIAYTAGFLRL